MSRELWKWDAPTGELVTPDELRRRQDARSPASKGKLPPAGPIVRCHEIWDRELQRIVPAEEFYRSRAHGNRSKLSAPMLIRDIQPYRNIAVDNGVISSRSQHRQMLKDRGLEEVGNDFKALTTRDAPKSEPVRETMKRAIQEVQSGRQARPVERVDLSNAVVA